MQSSIKAYMQLCDDIRVLLLTVENMLLNEQCALQPHSESEQQVLVAQRERFVTQVSQGLQQLEQDFCEVLYG
jgi:hypothetical protein